MLKTPSRPVKFLILAGLLSAEAFGQNRFLVRVTGDVGQIAVRNRLSVIRSLGGSATGVHVLSGTAADDPQLVLRSLATEAEVKSAESERPMRLPGLSSRINTNPTSSRLTTTRLDGTPTSYYTSMAAAAYVNQQAGQIVNLARALTAVTGEGVTVAIIDTGIDRTHPVLALSVGNGYDFVNRVAGGQEQLDINQETTPILDQETTPILDQETTPILDGGSAVILNQETTPILDQETTPILDSKKYPAYGHGTMVAGLVHLAAPKARLLPVRVFGANGAATISQVVEGIYWAVDQGANVINMSFSTTTNSPVLQAAIDFAIRRGVILVASAGNDGKATPVWPAAYDSVIGVGSTNNFQIRSHFSNFGSPMVSLAAPGEANITLYPGKRYAQVWGTSFSAPLVAGAAALLVDTRERTDAERAASALSHATFVGQDLGAGVLDLYEAIVAVRRRTN
jgi:subtilisin family serine protease